jgi:hypothetical protein
MKKLAALVIAAISIVTPLRGQQPAPRTLTWTNAGGMYCMPVMTEDGQPVLGGSYYCPFQSSSFVSPPDGLASLYLPDLILEGINVTPPIDISTSFNPDGSVRTFSRTSTLSSPNGWTGTATQNFVVTTYQRCVRYGCHTYTVSTDVGGSGTITGMF